MPNISVLVPHRLSQDEALNRIRNFIAQARIQFGDRMTITQEEWSGYLCTFAGSATGFNVAGNIVVSSTDVTVQSTLPGAAFFFKGRIEATLRNQLAQILS